MEWEGGLVIDSKLGVVLGPKKQTLQSVVNIIYVLEWLAR